MPYLYLPCEIGDEVYLLSGVDDIYPYKVDSFEYNGVLWANLVNNDYVPEHRSVKRCISFDLGKTIFLSKADALAKTRKFK